jgi:hypothetical protein
MFEMTRILFLAVKIETKSKRNRRDSLTRFAHRFLVSIDRSEVPTHKKVSYFGAPAAMVFEFLLVSGALIIFCVKPIEKYLVLEPRTGTECQLHAQG